MMGYTIEECRMLGFIDSKEFVRLRDIRAAFPHLSREEIKADLRRLRRWRMAAFVQMGTEKGEPNWFWVRVLWDGYSPNEPEYDRHALDLQNNMLKIAAEYHLTNSGW